MNSASFVVNSCLRIISCSSRVVLWEVMTPVGSVFVSSAVLLVVRAFVAVVVVQLSSFVV